MDEVGLKDTRNIDITYEVVMMGGPEVKEECQQGPDVPNDMKCQRNNRATKEQKSEDSSRKRTDSERFIEDFDKLLDMCH